jgi:hypothetical protein
VAPDLSLNTFNNIPNTIPNTLEERHFRVINMLISEIVVNRDLLTEASAVAAPQLSP